MGSEEQRYSGYRGTVGTEEQRNSRYNGTVGTEANYVQRNNVCHKTSSKRVFLSSLTTLWTRTAHKSFFMTIGFAKKFIHWFLVQFLMVISKVIQAPPGT